MTIRSHSILILQLWAFLSVGQSPWVPGKGKGYGQLAFTTIGPYSELFGKDNSSVSLTREVTDQTLQAYGEIGVGEKSSLLFVLPYKILKTGSPVIGTSPTISAGTFNTVGNIQVALKRNFLNQDLTISGRLLLELPTSGFDDATGLRGGLNAATVYPSVSVGRGFSQFYFFSGAGLGLRTNNYSHDFRINAEGGYKPLNAIWIIVVLDWVQNFENGTVTDHPQQLETGLYLNNQSYFAYGLKGIVEILTGKFGVNFGIYGAGSGYRVAKSPSINAGVFVKW